MTTNSRALKFSLLLNNIPSFSINSNLVSCFDYFALATCE